MEIKRPTVAAIGGLALLTGGLVGHTVHNGTILQPGDASTGGQVVLLLGLMVNLGVQIYREQREHRWQLEAAERQRRELAEHEARVKAELAAQTETLTNRMRTRITDLSQRFDGLLDASGVKRRQGDRPEP